MDTDLKNALICCETDLDGALYRFGNDANLYVTCLKTFLSDNTISEYKQAADSESWDDAFTAMHALKGVAGNMGFVPLFHSAAELVILIRKGKLDELDAAFAKVVKYHSEITDVIKKYCE